MEALSLSLLMSSFFKGIASPLRMPSISVDSRSSFSFEVNIAAEVFESSPECLGSFYE